MPATRLLPCDATTASSFRCPLFKRPFFPFISPLFSFSCWSLDRADESIDSIRGWHLKINRFNHTTDSQQRINSFHASGLQIQIQVCFSLNPLTSPAGDESCWFLVLFLYCAAVFQALIAYVSGLLRRSRPARRGWPKNSTIETARSRGI